MSSTSVHGWDCAPVCADGLGLTQSPQQRLGGEQDVVSLADCGMPQRLGQVALAGTARAGDQDADLLLNVAAGGQVIDGRTVQVGQAIEVEALEGLLPTEAGAAYALAEFLLVPASQLVVDKQGEEVGVGQPLSAAGVRFKPKQYAQSASQHVPSLATKRITPHT